jgi:hypothetical protein
MEGPYHFASFDAFALFVPRCRRRLNTEHFPPVET